MYHLDAQNQLTRQVLPFSYLQIMANIENDLWLGTTQGIYVMDKSKQLLHQGQPFFADYNISAALKDKEGNYWFGTINEGILFVPDFEVKHYLSVKNKPYRLVWYQNKVFIGTKRGEIMSFDPLTEDIQLFYKTEQAHEMYFLHTDSLKQQILTTSDRFRVFNAAGSLLEMRKDAVKDACRIDVNTVAYAFTGAVALRQEKNSLTENPFPYTHNTESFYQYLLKGNRGKSLAYLPHNQTLYFTTSTGTFKADKEKMTEILDGGGKLYFFILRTYKKEVYALDAQGVLAKIDEKGILHKDILPNLRSQRMRIVDDKLFLFSDKTLFFIDLAAANFIPQKVEVGISASEINDLLLAEKKLYLATDEGFLSMNWQNVTQKHSSPLLNIHEMSFQRQKFALSDKIRLPYTQNEVEIKYAILSFRNAAEKNVLYRINQGEWQTLSPQSRMLKLAGLAPNHYVIELKLGDCWQRVSFEIMPPFWKSDAFISIILLIIISIAYYFYYSRTTLLKKQNNLLLEKLTLEKDLHKSLMASIKSQMNPHFLFNALNTLQAFIFSDDKRSAADYLGRFSRLMRMILEMSEKDYISLNEEIEALTLYLALEKIRFERDFSYIFSIEKNIETDKILIPAMIIQPYVENAIKHGLLHKKTDRMLHISIENKANNLLISIDDNGIGRKRAGELQEIRQKKHQSFATKANLKRVELLNQENANIGVTYTDKVAENGEAIGTTVVISLPLRTK